VSNDVQLENGYTKISNEILNILAVTNLNGTQRRILDVVFRYTYGFNRKNHKMSVTFISSATKLNNRNVKRELNNLIDMKIIIIVKEATFSSSRVISFNKDFNTWLLNEHQGANIPPGDKADTQPGGELDTSPGGELTTQEIKYKENIKENSTSTLYNDLFEDLWKLYPNKKGKSAVSKKSKESIYKIGMEKMAKAIDNYKQDLKVNTWKQSMNGSTFFNGRYEDYFEIQESQHETTVSIYPEL
jgi:phage replication O-like protein O